MCCIKVPLDKPIRYKKSETVIYVFKHLEEDEDGDLSSPFYDFKWEGHVVQPKRNITWTKLRTSRFSREGYYAYWSIQEAVKSDPNLEQIYMMEIPPGTRYYTDGINVIAETMMLRCKVTSEDV